MFPNPDSVLLNHLSHILGLIKLRCGQIKNNHIEIGYVVCYLSETLKIGILRSVMKRLGRTLPVAPFTNMV